MASQVTLLNDPELLGDAEHELLTTTTTTVLLGGRGKRCTWANHLLLPSPQFERCAAEMMVGGGARIVSLSPVSQGIMTRDRLDRAFQTDTEYLPSTDPRVHSLIGYDFFGVSDLLKEKEKRKDDGHSPSFHSTF